MTQLAFLSSFQMCGGNLCIVFLLVGRRRTSGWSLVSFHFLPIFLLAQTHKNNKTFQFGRCLRLQLNNHQLPNLFDVDECCGQPPF